LVDLPAGAAEQEQSSSTTAEETADETADDDDDVSQSSAQPSGKSKTDDNARQVSREEAEAYAKECGLLFFEASAKTGSNVGEVFTEIGESRNSIWENLLTRQLKQFRLTPLLPSLPAMLHETLVLLSLKSASTLTKALKQRREVVVDSLADVGLGQYVFTDWDQVGRRCLYEQCATAAQLSYMRTTLNILLTFTILL